jgi:hypothetical protein
MFPVDTVASSNIFSRNLSTILNTFTTRERHLKQLVGSRTSSFVSEDIVGWHNHPE